MKKLVKYSLLSIALLIFLGLGASAYIAFLVNTGRVESSAIDKQVEVKKEKITPEGLFIAINEVRREYGLPQFSHNPKLDESSKLKCDDMIQGNYYDHINPTTGKIGNSYIEDVGINLHNGSSENLADGKYKDSKDVVDGWMASESHRASIIDPKYLEIGFATCVIPKWPTYTAIVQHKIAPY